MMDAEDAELITEDLLSRQPKRPIPREESLADQQVSAQVCSPHGLTRTAVKRSCRMPCQSALDTQAGTAGIACIGK